MNKKVVLITGANRGIGKSIKILLEKDQTYKLLTPSREELDLASMESIDRYFLENNEIDIVINNAGINLIRSIEEINENNMLIMQQINLYAPLKIIHHVIPYMKDKKYGKIVNVSSIWGIRSKEKRALYSMTKFGINGITKALARELGQYNILINAVCPGYVNTEMTQQNISLAEQKKIKTTIPLERFAEPEEIAKVVKFLISEENSYITGQAIVIDGGFIA
jgi:3-oxoacyl-[acyl-carrier protein] reductase